MSYILSLRHNSSRGINKRGAEFHRERKSIQCETVQWSKGQGEFFMVCRLGQNFKPLKQQFIRGGKGCGGRGEIGVGIYLKRDETS